MIDDILGAPVSRETRDRLELYARRLVEENERQNLISKTTVEDVWTRHIADSAQLVALAPPELRWVDLGSGPGLPGMVVAILTGDPMTLVEPRRLRVEFLQRTIAELGLTNAVVVQAKSQGAKGQFDVITARAVAKAGELLGISHHLAHSRTRYLLMKGRSAQSELDALHASWQGEYTLVPSRTDPDAAIIVAEHVRRKG
jgi:16S rRNA (guanine527-N7)-methyltransferase